MDQKLVDRIIGAFTFRAGVYDDVEGDASFTQMAWIIVAVVGFLSQLGSHQNIVGAVVGVAFALIGFYVFTWIVNWVARELFKADVTQEELIRTLGLAYVWNIVGLLGVVAGILVTIGSLLGLAASLLAAKAALDLEWSQTIVSVVIGWIVMFLIIIVGGTVIGILGFGAAVATGAIR
jgi:hypothetical protein